MVWVYKTSCRLVSQQIVEAVVPIDIDLFAETNFKHYEILLQIVKYFLFIYLLLSCPVPNEGKGF